LAVPCEGEIIDASRSIALKVTMVRWTPPDQGPLLFLGRSVGTISSVQQEEDDLELTMAEQWVDELREAGWQLSDW
jgi:hypothetical protein